MKSGTPKVVETPVVEIPGWYINFQAAVLKQLPRPGEIDQLTAEGWTNNQGALKKGLREYMLPPVSAHLYEFSIHKDGANVDELRERLAGKFAVLNDAKEMMAKIQHDMGPKEDVIIRVYSAKVLGVVDWSETEFFDSEGWKHLKGMGFSECLPDDAPYIRLAHNNQKFDEYIQVAHNPISAHGFSDVFNITNNGDHGCHLGGYSTQPQFRLHADSLIAVRVVNNSWNL